VPGRIPHDFRRTAARNLVNAGVDPLLTMQLVGWEDPAMLKRYRIVDDNTLVRGAAKLNEYLEEQKAKPGKVVAINAQ
jgi:integrase